MNSLSSKLCRWIILAFVTSVFALSTLAGCSSEPETSTEDGNQDTISTRSIKNATYRLEMLPLESVSLKNGRYEDKANNMRTNIITSDLGLLGNPPQLTAAVLLSSNAGGSGIFYELVLLQNQNDTLKQIDSALIGDRILLESLRVRDGIIDLQFVAAGVDDPMCCPTEQRHLAYKLVNQKLQISSTSTNEALD